MRREAILDFLAGIVNETDAAMIFLYCLVLRLMQCPAIFRQTLYQQVQACLTLHQWSID